MAESSHIVLATSYLHVPGGYEKMMVSTAGLFAEKGHQVTLLILDYTAEIYYAIHPTVKIVHLPMDLGISPGGNMIGRKVRMWKDVRKLKKILHQLKPDVLICTEYHFAIGAILAGAKKLCKVMSWEHHHYGTQHLNRFWKYLQTQTYRKLDAVICLNADEQQFYKSLNRQAKVIPNFIHPAGNIIPDPAVRYDIITVTRFNHIKGIDLLMEVARKILHANPHLKWKVIGYGEQKDTFTRFIKNENLADQLIYKPADMQDLAGEYQSALLFVMTSRNECFPLVLLEAMNTGLPCIAFDCETGPRHIIAHHQTGLLIEKENTDKMASAILSLLDDPQTRNRMETNAKTAIQSFYPCKIYALWEKVIQGNANSGEGKDT